MYRYAVENLNLSEIKILKSDLSYTQKGHQIENWLYEKKIDFCLQYVKFLVFVFGITVLLS